MNAEITNRIGCTLDRIEDEHGVKILYACESGSRAWGFESADSDYDVRFIYVHPPAWYLSVDLETRRDVVELWADGSLDLSGWDLRKALNLLLKSNPPLLEWLGSPVVYREQPDLFFGMRDLASLCYSPKACLYHYLHMARGNFREYLKGETVWLKKYLYVLRPLIAVLWIENGRGPAPMELHVLVDRMIEDQALKDSIHKLIQQKRDGQELERGPRIPVISNFIERELNRLEHRTFDGQSKKLVPDIFNQYFRMVLKQAWPETQAHG